MEGSTHWGRVAYSLQPAAVCSHSLDGSGHQVLGLVRRGTLRLESMVGLGVGDRKADWRHIDHRLAGVSMGVEHKDLDHRSHALLPHGVCALAFPPYAASSSHTLTPRWRRHQLQVLQLLNPCYGCGYRCHHYGDDASSYVAYRSQTPRS